MILFPADTRLSTGSRSSRGSRCYVWRLESRGLAGAWPPVWNVGLARPAERALRRMLVAMAGILADWPADARPDQPLS